MRIQPVFRWMCLLLVVAALVTACAPAAPAPTASISNPPTSAPAAPAAADATPTVYQRTGPKELILATTTSTRDSGLLDVLLPMFEKATGYTVKMIAVGTGQALKMGEQGNADVLLVHAPKSEEEYMGKGLGKDRQLVMHNDFIIVGPANDPVGIKGLKLPDEAFKKIADAKQTFVSRADDSGTNKAELAIWKKAGITPGASDAWYKQTGQGMGDTLRIASELGGYTLTDRATYLALKDKLQLDVLMEGDKSLLNIYHVITVNPDKWPAVNYTAAKAFADFLVSADIQKVIGEFGKEKYAQPLFFSDAGKNEADLGK